MITRVSRTATSVPKYHHVRAYTNIRPSRLRFTSIPYRSLTPSIGDTARAANRSFHTTLIRRADEPFKLADIGEGITEVEIISWAVKEGDMVEEFDTLCEVQSDKSTVELTAPFSGKIHHIAFGDGANVKVGQVLCRIMTEGEEADPASSVAEAASKPAHASKQGSHSEQEGKEAVQKEENEEVSQAEELSEILEKEAETQQPDMLGADGETLDTPSTGSTAGSAPPEPPAPTRISRPNPDSTTPSKKKDRRSTPEDHYIPPPPPRQIVRPVQEAHGQMTTMDRALLASLKAAAEAGEAAEAAFEAADLLGHRDTAMDLAGSAAFSGEGSVVRGNEPKKKEERLEAVPERRERQEGRKEIVKASPAVRTMAGRLGVRLEDITPTGEGGRVTQQDVQNAVMVQRGSAGYVQAGGTSSGSTPASRPSGPNTTSSASATTPRPVLAEPGERSKIPEITKVEFGRTRKVMFRAMGDMAHVPHFGYSHTLNLTHLLPYLRALNAPPAPPSSNYLASDIPSSQARNPISPSPKQKTTLLSFLVKGLLLAMEEHPIMRARAKEQGSSRFLEIARDGVIGVAVSDPKYGLLTPSLPHLPPSTPLSTLTSALSALRQNPNKPTQPANLTISSVGGLGEGRGMMPVLPPGGGVAICAVGRARWEVEYKANSQGKIMDMSPEEVERGGTGAVLRCPVGWSGDHRVLEGAELIAFTETWKKYIEEPWRWISID